MKKHFSDASRNSKISKSDFKYIYSEIEDFKGYISLLKIKEINKVGYVPRENREDDCIINRNYIWLAMYPVDKNYAITAMFNEKNEIIEWYFDVINKSGLENNIPYIEDLYLDIVITYLGEIFVLDEDELHQAFVNKDITKEQFEVALKTRQYLVEKYKNEKNIEKLRDFTMKCLDEITGKGE